ncbi:hypothetical protein WN72_05600 [Bradyrhizobium arachidis]|uniref:Uncharacterized protein n=1 Tax=Bradyrhizobium arachidis TaxID=858423 RepID=A0AAE7NKC1_9BRAD|nr:hypothetical protein WN72_05600 [Bradyrhizobium arachidis]
MSSTRSQPTHSRRLLLVWIRVSERRQFGGALRTSAGVIAEIVVSALTAPVMMIFKSIAVWTAFSLGE